MSVPRRHARAGLGTAALVVLALTACSGGDEPDDEPAGSSAQPAPPVAVPIAAEGLPEGVTIGVVVSLTSPEDPGDQWSRAAEGAEVAAYRLGLGGTPVDVVAVNDAGTTDGAAAAVEDLAGRGVSGIVVATSGPHVSGAVDAADAAGVPLLLPYAADPDLPADGAAWLTGPTRPAIDEALVAALRVGEVSKPALVDAGGGEPAGLTPVDRRALAEGAPDQAVTRLARDLATLAADAAVDSVVVTGPAAQQAVVVRALQGAAVPLPVYLTPDALSPVLAADLVGSDGSLSSELVTVGPATGDAAALAPGAAGDALSAYFAGLRAAAADPGVEDFFDGRPFAEVAADADTRSHDAVVALVRAAAEAGSADPADVAAALDGLALDRADGLAGAGLDFSGQAALPADEVVTLEATPQDPGLRPAPVAGEAPRLHWFAAARA